MNYPELLSMVLSMTARADLVSEHRTAISGAIRKFHLADLFQRDLRIARINLANYPTTNFTWQIDTKSTVFERFRKLYHAKPVKQDYVATIHNLPSLPTDGWECVDEIPIKSPADLFDETGMALANYIFLAGTSLTLRLSNTQTTVDLAYFQYPEITIIPAGGLTFNSWVVDEMPEAVAAEAAATIFKMVGKDEEFQRHQILFADNLALLRQTAVMAN